jgi:hypothetical protein
MEPAARVARGLLLARPIPRPVHRQPSARRPADRVPAEVISFGCLVPASVIDGAISAEHPLRGGALNRRKDMS